MKENKRYALKLSLCEDRAGLPEKTAYPPFIIWALVGMLGKFL